jgi:hypothetical protein
MRLEWDLSLHMHSLSFTTILLRNICVTDDHGCVPHVVVTDDHGCVPHVVITYDHGYVPHVVVTDDHSTINLNLFHNN